MLCYTRAIHVAKSHIQVKHVAKDTGPGRLGLTSNVWAGSMSATAAAGRARRHAAVAASVPSAPHDLGKQVVRQ